MSDRKDIKLVGDGWDEYEGTILRSVRIDSDGDGVLTSTDEGKAITDDTGWVYAWNESFHESSTRGYVVVQDTDEEDQKDEDPDKPQTFEVVVKITAADVEELREALEFVHNYGYSDNVKIKIKE